MHNTNGADLMSVVMSFSIINKSEIFVTHKLFCLDVKRTLKQLLFHCAVAVIKIDKWGARIRMVILIIKPSSQKRILMRR